MRNARIGTIGAGSADERDSRGRDPIRRFSPRIFRAAVYND
jgi:hypothetical protein